MTQTAESSKLQYKRLEHGDMRELPSESTQPSPTPSTPRPPTTTTTGTSTQTTPDQAHHNPSTQKRTARGVGRGGGSMGGRRTICSERVCSDEWGADSEKSCTELGQRRQRKRLMRRNYPLPRPPLPSRLMQRWVEGGGGPLPIRHPQFSHPPPDCAKLSHGQNSRSATCTTFNYSACSTSHANLMPTDNQQIQHHTRCGSTSYSQLPVNRKKRTTPPNPNMKSRASLVTEERGKNTPQKSQVGRPH
jgi:hypothetical protein